MRIGLNKAMAAEATNSQEQPSSANARKQLSTLAQISKANISKQLSTLAQISQHSRDILGDYPEKKGELLNNLATAEAETERLKADLEAAEDLESYDAIADKLKRAELAKKFAQTALGKLDGAPRMAEQEYLEARSTCKAIMEQAVNAYRDKAESLMNQLKAARDEYMHIAEATNSTLVNLDRGANILQPKYRQVWEQYALRYDNGTPCRLATQSTLPPEERALKPHDSVLCAAWNAINKAYPKTSF